MKSKFLSLLAVTLILFACGTTTYTSTSSHAAYVAPADLQVSFMNQYPKATNVIWRAYDEASVPIDWELSGWAPIDARGHMVSFEMDGQQYLAWYDANGTWIGSTYTVTDHSKLPAAVRNLLKEKYSGYTIDKVQQEIWQDRVAYELKLKSSEKNIKLLVDKDGNVLKEKTND